MDAEIDTEDRHDIEQIYVALLPHMVASTIRPPSVTTLDIASTGVVIETAERLTDSVSEIVGQLSTFPALTIRIGLTHVASEDSASEDDLDDNMVYMHSIHISVTPVIVDTGVTKSVRG